MKCAICGSELTEGQLFCHNCGSKVGAGKLKCKILKEIRQRIADENGIPFTTSECHHEGDCAGTCPACEAELRYLEQELEKRQIPGGKALLSTPYSGPDGAGPSVPEMREPLAGEPAIPKFSGLGTGPGPWVPQTPGVPAHRFGPGGSRKREKESLLQRLRAKLRPSKERGHD